MPRSTQPGDGILAMVSLIANHELEVVDVGAGDGKWASYLRGRVKRIVAIERQGSWNDDACLGLLYDEVIIADARRMARATWDLYDVVILGDVLEHMERAYALRLVDELCASKATVYLTVPVSPDPQNGSDYMNPFESHLDQWDDETLVRYGWDRLHKGSVSYSKVIVGTYVLNKKRWLETKNDHR